MKLKKLQNNGKKKCNSLDEPGVVGHTDLLVAFVLLFFLPKAFETLNRHVNPPVGRPALQQASPEKTV